jgi:hypothetical protein
MGMLDDTRLIVSAMEIQHERTLIEAHVIIKYIQYQINIPQPTHNH